MVSWGDSDMQDVTTRDLLAEFLARQSLIEHEKQTLWRLEGEIKRRMNENGAREVYFEGDESPGYGAKLESKFEYDKDVLTPLFEYEEIPSSELHAARIPEKVIPATWNMTNVKSLARYSERIRKLIASARSETEPRLKVWEDK